MIDPKILLAEKIKYGLEPVVYEHELAQLKNDVPVQKIIGYIEMANVKIDLSQFVLIPRYETEELIYHAIDLIKKYQLKNILDLGCGSGFIGIAIKKALKERVNVTLSDIDPNAIEQTKINLELNQSDANLVCSDWFSNLDDRFDLIISNPPYLKWTEKNNMNDSVLKHEPYQALFANDQGLEPYKIIEQNLNYYLNDNGLVLLEINPLNQDWFLKHKYQLIADINKKNRFAFKSKKLRNYSFKI